MPPILEYMEALVIESLPAKFLLFLVALVKYFKPLSQGQWIIIET